ncbi:MAG TPA: DUF222 domain-containing protein [Acidimicrobiia bacterium]|nr:DUF222 domain-containing protein [Acidimicrobiia bacterium]
MGEIPADLDQLDPGLLLALFLDSADNTEASGYDQVTLLGAYQKMANYYQAKVYETMASIHHLTRADSDLPVYEHFEWVAAEIACALHLTRKSSESDLSFAIDLRERLPQVFQAFASGLIDLRRARVLVYGTEHLAEDQARRVVDQVIAEAPQLTSGQLYARVRKLAMQINPEEAADRYRHTLGERRVFAEATPDGTTHLLGCDLPPDRVAAIMAKINGLARSLKTKGEERSFDQLRADVFLDLLDGKTFDSFNGRGVVDLHVDLATLSLLNDHPGELGGYGPVIADIARQVAQQQVKGEWRWSLKDPHTGSVLCSGLTRRRPTAAQRRMVETRRRTCIFPGCRMPAIRCDLDHRRPFAQGGETCPHNLEPLCRFHHQLRHRTNWTHQPLPNGDHLWISPLGRRYTTSGRSP